MTSVPESDLSRPAIRWLLLAAVLLGTVLRFHHFAEPSMWLDEYATSWVAAAETWSGAVERAVGRDQSIAHGLVARLACELLGNNPFALRLPSVLFGIATVALAYPLALAVLGSRRAAVLAPFVFAVQENLIQISQDARPYALAVFFTLLSFRAFLGLIERDSIAGRATWVLATAAAYYCHTLFGFIGVIQLTYLTLSAGRDWLGERRWWTSLAGLALAVAPSATQLTSLFGRRQELDWIGSQPWQFPIKIFVDFLNPKVFALTACFVLLARLSADGPRPRSRLLATWFLLPLVAFALVPPLLGTHLAFPRYVMFALPAALLITVLLLTLAPRGRRRWTALALYVAATFAFNLLPALEGAGTFSYNIEGGWDRAARWLETQAEPEDLILFGSGFIEADRVAEPESGSGSDLLTLFDWPLLYHLPPERGEHVHSLPKRVDDRTFPYVQRLLTEAQSQSRVWLAGDPQIVREISRPFQLESSKLRLYQERSFGQATVMELRRRALPETPPSAP